MTTASNAHDALVRMGADHFETLFEDDGWQDTLELWCETSPLWLECQGSDDFDLGMLVQQKIESDLVLEIVAEIMRRTLQAAREVQQDMTNLEIDRQIARNTMKRVGVHG